MPDGAPQPAARADRAPQQGEFDSARIVGLSDSVFAFAMTLMVLQFDTPSPDRVAAGRLARDVIEQWPSLLSYILTFLVVASFWVAHHRTFRYIRSGDAVLVWLNILFLLSISFLPFPTEVMGEYGDTAFAAIFYAASMTVTSLLLTLIWVYVTRQRHLMHGADERVVQYYLYRGFGLAAIFLLSIPLATIDANLARGFWALLFVYLQVLGRLYSDVRGQLLGM